MKKEGEGTGETCLAQDDCDEILAINCDKSAM